MRVVVGIGRWALIVGGAVFAGFSTFFVVLFSSDHIPFEWIVLLVLGGALLILAAALGGGALVFSITRPQRIVRHTAPSNYLRVPSTHVRRTLALVVAGAAAVAVGVALAVPLWMLVDARFIEGAFGLDETPPFLALARVLGGAGWLVITIGVGRWVRRLMNAAPRAPRL